MLLLSFYWLQRSLSTQYRQVSVVLRWNYTSLPHMVKHFWQVYVFVVADKTNKIFCRNLKVQNCCWWYCFQSFFIVTEHRNLMNFKWKYVSGWVVTLTKQKFICNFFIINKEWVGHTLAIQGYKNRCAKCSECKH